MPTKERHRVQLRRTDEPFAAQGVDQAKGRIDGIVVMQKGIVEGSMMPGFPFEVDDESLDSLVAVGNEAAAKRGVKMRHNHPDECNPSHGSQVGKAAAFRREGDSVLCDGTMLDAAARTPHGDLRTWTLEMAEEAPEQFGVSVWGTAFFEQMVDDQGNEIHEDENGDRLLPKMRMATLTSVDFVDPPAATRDGLFGASLADSAATLLDAAINEAGIDLLDDAPGSELLEALAGTRALAGVLSTRTVAASAPEQRTTTITLSDDDGRQRAAVFVNRYLEHRGAAHRAITAGDIATALSKGPQTMPEKPKTDGKGAASPAAPEPNNVTLTIRTDQAVKPDDTPDDPKPETLDPKATAAAAQKRVLDIQALGKLFPGVDLDETITACVEDLDCTVEAANAKVLQAVAAVHAKTTPKTAGATVVAGAEPRRKFFALAASAIGVRMGVDKIDEKTPEPQRKTFEEARRSGLLGLGPQQICREMLRLAGIEGTNLMDADQLWATAMGQRIIPAGGVDTEQAIGASVGVGHGTGDFPLLMANQGNKALVNAFMLAPTTYQIWVQIGDLADFKTANRLRLSEAPHLEERAPGEPARQGSMAERGEPITLLNYAKAFSYTRQMFINDDLRAFSDLGSKFGAGAAHTIERAVYVLWTSNAGAGPTLSDSTALFHADHNNLGTGGAVSQATIQELVTLMMTQTGFGDDGSITTLNIAPAWTLSGPTLAAQIEAIVKSPYSGSDARRDPQNSKVAILDPIYVPQLELLDSAAYYAVARPNEAQTMEVAFLNGQRTPRTKVEQGTLVDGVTIVVDLDWGIAVTGGHEGAVRNAGS